MKVLNYFYCIFIIQSCVPELSNNFTPVFRSKNSEYLMRKSYLDTEIKFEQNDGYLLANTEIIKLKNGLKLPKTTFLSDYSSNAQSSPAMFVFLAKLGSSFYDKLSPDIVLQLKNFKVLPEKTDIFINVQWTNEFFLGEREDHVNEPYSAFSTRLKAHAWVDSELPLEFPGYRLRKNVLYGIFDAEYNLSSEVQNNQLKSFEVYLHDSTLSPRTAKIRFNPEITQSFCSLVIDNNEPDNIRANVTLHLLLIIGDRNDFIKATYKTKNIAEFVEALRSNESLKAIVGVRKVINLLSDK